MAVTDPVADMLTRIRNANSAMKDTVVMPSSKLKENLAALLVREGYVEKFETKIEEDKKTAKKKPGSQLIITLKFPANERGDRMRTISGLKRISKPGLRQYCAHSNIPRVLGGMGIAIVSTNKGLLTDREARRQQVGGEVLCYVW